MKVSRILHAGYIFESGEISIAFDPIFESPFSVNCYAYPEVRFDLDAIRALSLSAVFLSHIHDDHASLASLQLLPRETPIYLYAASDELIELIGAIGFTRVKRLELDSHTQIGPFEVHCLEALDTDVDSIFHVQVEGLNILNVVDSWIGPETFAALSRHSWDLVLWPFQTMREIEALSPSRAEPCLREIPHEWLEQIAELAPKYLIPSSCQFRFEDWSWLNSFFFPITYRAFAQAIVAASPSSEVVRLDPGRSIELTSNTLRRIGPLEWIHPIGEQEVDYEFDESIAVPTVDEIARNFSALSRDEFDRIARFCEFDLSASEISAPWDGIDENKISKLMWRLAIYDHLGCATVYEYTWLNGKLTHMPADSKGRTLAWTTDIAAAKLLCALERGETLTSLYVRINDTRFSDEIEAILAESDVLHDPLLMSLFSRSAVSYQRAQFEEWLAQVKNSREPEPTHRLEH